MGSGSSTAAALSKDDKRENIRERASQLRTVSTFMLSAYACSSRVEAVWLLLSSDSGLKHFTNFVASERATDYLDLFLELNAIKTMSKPTVYNMQQQILHIAEEYIHANSHSYIIISSGLKRDIEGIFSQNVDNLAEPLAHILEIIEKLRGEMVTLMARDQFSRFLTSRFYKNWRANERGFATASTKENSKDVIQDYISAGSRDKLSAGSSKVTTSEMFQLEKNVVPEDPTIRAFANVDNAALENILRHASWLSALISAVEVLPISFLLCKVVTKNGVKRFPLVYANKYVERMVGFRRKTLIGKSYDEFLRCAETEKEASAELEAMTQQFQAASMVLTHANSKGVTFKNLVATSPVFDHHGTCDYIIYLMFNLSGTNNSSNTATGSNSAASSGTRVTLRQLSSNDLSSSIDIYALERKKAESLLRILPDYIIPEIDDVALPGWRENLREQFRPFRVFYNRVLPAAPESEVVKAAAAKHHVVTAKLLADAEARRASAKLQQTRAQPRVMSIREAEQSKGPDGRLGGGGSNGNNSRSRSLSQMANFFPSWA